MINIPFKLLEQKKKICRLFLQSQSNESKGLIQKIKYHEYGIGIILYLSLHIALILYYTALSNIIFGRLNNIRKTLIYQQKNNPGNSDDSFNIYHSSD